MTSDEAYQELRRRAVETATLHSCAAVLGWDEQTYLPPGGIEHRGNQLALLAGLAHDKATDPRIGELLAHCEQSDLVADPESPSAVNVREWRRRFDREAKLPKSLVEALARTTTSAQQEWAVARGKADFARFRPWLEKIIHLKREQADAYGYNDNRYDALLDDYEQGITTRQVRDLFENLRDDLVRLVERLVTAAKRPNITILHRDFPVDRQRIFGEAAAAAIGFDFHRGRLDSTVHPFCSGIGPGDCRITTRYNPKHFSESFFGILHETGHAMYEQGLDPAHFGTPMGDAVSLGIHESQSRLWENNVGRGRGFWRHFFPRARQIFHEALRDVSEDEFLFAINNVQPTFIRVEADEATYNLHILLRFEIEEELINGRLDVADIPNAWNDRMVRFLGIMPPDDRLGCLQDIHWSAGLIGYFPTYTLGNLYAAQIFDTASREVGDLDTLFKHGEFRPLLDWLRHHIHQHGQRWNAGNLIKRVTGKAPAHEPLLAELQQQFEPLYGL